MRCKLLRIHRLRKRAVFRKVYEDGRFVANRLLAFHFLPNPENRQRVGFAAGKKLGGATVRNRCKRRLRECYRLNRDKMPAGMDCIIVARKALLQADWAALTAAFRDALRRSRQMIDNKRQ